MRDPPSTRNATDPYNPPRRKELPVMESSQAKPGPVAHAESFLRTVLSSVLDPLVAIDVQGSILAASDSVERVLGWKPAELLGRNVNVLIPSPHHEQHDQYLAQYRLTGKTSILNRTRQFDVRRQDGSLVACDLSVARGILPDGSAVFIGTFRDVSERLRAEQALRESERQEKAMLRALAAIGEQAAVLAHEIKNPITAVNLALRAVADQIGEDQQVILEDLVSRMRRLEELMRRTLSFAKPLDLRREVLDAQKLLEDTIAHVRGELTKGAAEARALPAQGRVQFAGDAHHLEEVLSNLIRNAVEAKGLGAHVALSAECDGEGFVRIHVDDDGPGIPAELRPSLFRPFTTTKRKGTGLGLAICKKIVEEHGGTISIEDAPTGGARFVLRFPTRV
jgi:two-component system sensor kinase FixL